MKEKKLPGSRVHKIVLICVSVFSLVLLILTLMERAGLRLTNTTLILNGGEGLVKIIAGAEYGEILGMHIIGPRATDLIAEGALAIEGEMTLDEIIDTIHSHPTVTETMREAALNAEKRAIHTKN